MSPQVRKKLEKISDQTDESLSQVVRRSVAVYEMLLAETNAGGEIVIKANDGTEKHVVLI
ncbi:hypothetical protein Pan14r_49710 [Crateriforma conspicua]|uniref:Ribbon-helix-helix protein CopG domain-containing protein n=2 Tax=Crateriforma conspicua TaxID=2527996 RepID=A0A5C5YDX2_9PLAN|nr:hypothetical protein Pan14r_49710 [Crateriforma conspicua]